MNESDCWKAMNRLWDCYGALAVAVAMRRAHDAGCADDLKSARDWTWIARVVSERCLGSERLYRPPH